MVQVTPLRRTLASYP